VGPAISWRPPAKLSPRGRRAPSDVLILLDRPVDLWGSNRGSRNGCSTRGPGNRTQDCPSGGCNDGRPSSDKQCHRPVPGLSCNARYVQCDPRGSTLIHASFVSMRIRTPETMRCLSFTHVPPQVPGPSPGTGAAAVTTRDGGHRLPAGRTPELPGVERSPQHCVGIRVDLLRATRVNSGGLHANSEGHACELRWSCVRTQGVHACELKWSFVRTQVGLACELSWSCVRTQVVVRATSSG
jgi:hypothetical protein